MKSKLETLSSEHHHACEELDRLQLELDFFKKEREEFEIRTKELNMGSELSNNLQVLSSSFVVHEESYLRGEKGKRILRSIGSGASSIAMLIDHILFLSRILKTNS